MDIIRSIKVRFSHLFLKYTLYKKFRSFGVNSIINKPLIIGKPENISIGNNVAIQYKVWLTANPQTGNKLAELVISDGCHIGNYNHIYATSSIILEKNVLTADKVYISDNLHNYEDINTPIHSQAIKQLKHVRIGEGTWLGENVCVIGASIGKQSVIGANSVVTKDIPDYCVAVGIPAHIIKRYNFETKQWEKTNPDGTFIEIRK